MKILLWKRYNPSFESAPSSYKRQNLITEGRKGLKQKSRPAYLEGGFEESTLRRFESENVDITAVITED